MSAKRKNSTVTYTLISKCKYKWKDIGAERERANERELCVYKNVREKNVKLKSYILRMRALAHTAHIYTSLLSRIFSFMYGCMALFRFLRVGLPLFPFVFRLASSLFVYICTDIQYYFAFFLLLVPPIYHSLSLSLLLLLFGSLMLLTAEYFLCFGSCCMNAVLFVPYTILFVCIFSFSSLFIFISLRLHHFFRSFYCSYF